MAKKQGARPRLSSFVITGLVPRLLFVMAGLAPAIHVFFSFAS
jgi:hypothetical protein